MMFVSGPPDKHVSPVAVSSSRQTCDVIEQYVNPLAIELRRLSRFLQHYLLVRHYFEVGRHTERKTVVANQCYDRISEVPEPMVIQTCHYSRLRKLPAILTYRRSSMRVFSWARLGLRSASRTSRTFHALPSKHRCRALSFASSRGTSPIRGQGQSRQRGRCLERVRRVFRPWTLQGLRIEARLSGFVSHSRPS